MSAHHAKKNVSFSIIPVIPRIVPTREQMTGSGNQRAKEELSVIRYRLQVKQDCNLFNTSCGMDLHYGVWGCHRVLIAIHR